MKRYNLSGIYIFDQFEGEERRQPTCIEDCTPEKRQEWLESLEKEALINCVNHLCGTLHAIAEQHATLVDKVCEWLEDNAKGYAYSESYTSCVTIDYDSLLQDLRESLKEEDL